MIKYLSLFTGIGGFELGIQNVIKNAECIAFSEIDKFALKVYNSHFPNHNNLGDITKITEKQIKDLIKTHGYCDLIVGGFPCTNLSSFARVFKNCNSDGLDGPASGLFWDMVRVMNWVKKYNPKNKKLNVIIENNASMSNKYKVEITEELEKILGEIYCTRLNSADFGVQIRKRLFWTTFPVDTSSIKCEQEWDDVLLPVDEISKYLCTQKYVDHKNKIVQRKSNSALRFEKNGDRTHSQVDFESEYSTRWNLYEHSDNSREELSISYPIGKSRPLLARSHLLVDRRCENGVFIRWIAPIEACRLFYFPDDWIPIDISDSRANILIGRSVVVKIIEFLVNNFIGS